MIDVGMDNLYVTEGAEVDLLPLLKEYETVEEGSEVPATASAIYGTVRAADLKAQNVKVLDPARQLDIPLFGDASLSGIGWIGDKLHVRISHADSTYHEGEWAINFSPWLNNGRGYDCYDDLGWISLDYSGTEEDIFSIVPEEVEYLELKASLEHVTDMVKGPWNIQVPLSSIYLEEADISEAEIETVIASFQDTGRPHALWQFLCSWAGGDTAGILDWCLPEWKVNTEDPRREIEIILATGVPKSFQLNRFDSSDDDSIETVLLTVELESADSSESTYVNVNVTFRKDAQNVFRLDPSALVITEHAKPDASMKMVSLSEESILHASLEEYYPEICEKLIPVNLSCEKQGIRVEVISALLREQEGWFLYSLEDLEGRYTGNELFSGLSDNVGAPKSGGGAELYVSASGHKVIRMIHTEYQDPVGTSDRIINMNMTDLYVEQNVSVDLSPLIARYAETTEGVAQPSVPKTYWRNSKSTIDVGNMKILDPSRSLDLSLSRDGILSGIGWIDGKLHVQFSGPKDSVINCTFNDKSVKTGDKDTHYYLADLRWADKSSGKEFVERVLDWQPEDPDQTHLEADFSVSVMAIKDTWTIPVSLLSILEGAGK